MNLEDFLKLAKEYDALGGAIQEQLHAIELGDGLATQNTNALAHIRTFLLRLSDYLEDESAANLADAIEQELGEEA